MRRFLFLFALLVAAIGPAVAAPQFEFLAAPQINLSLVYRLDKLTGDVIACQYAHNPGKTDIEPGRVRGHGVLSQRRRRDQAGARRLRA